MRRNSSASGRRPRRRGEGSELPATVGGCPVSPVQTLVFTPAAAHVSFFPICCRTARELAKQKALLATVANREKKAGR